MYLFFRNLTLIAAPMVLAMVSVICTMALLVISGQTVHIMSSMIPIFIMPIAVLDSVHILSEFFDYYPRLKSRRLTLEHVMRELFTPMFYTSLTTALGFLSLALVPIPPVQVFGLFVAIGVLIAWLLSMLFIPAYIFLVPKARIEALAKAANTADGGKGDGGIMGRWLQGLRVRVIRQARPVLAAAVIGALALVYGIAQIQVNDNPVRWFHDNHEISIADRVLNHHFAGTYMAYIAFKGMDDDPAAIRKAWQAALQTLAADYPGTESLVEELADAGASQGAALFDAMEAKVEAILDRDDLSRDGEDLALDALDKVDELRNAAQTFKQPEMLRYLASLQQALAATGVVGKSVSITDFVKTVNRELHGADPDQYRVPDTPSGVAQALLTYQNSHRPQDIWRFITTDYRQGIVWLMLESGDNIDMTAVVDAAEAFVRQNPPPAEVSMDWLGLNYINVVWQDKMVSGMVSAILGGYLMVLLVLYLLLRSVRLALIAMAPLTLSLLAIYGMLGLAGKAYDMPVAVLSALTIGLAVDFAIHFLVRYRHLSDQTNDPERALTLMFDEPARAILRNLLVVAIGFLPLLLAPLVPYNTVGYLIAAILFTSGIAALVVIPAILSLSDSTAAQGALAPVQHDHNRLE
jgi:predicted RND superfamily exporter protein